MKQNKLILLLSKVPLHTQYPSCVLGFMCAVLHVCWAIMCVVPSCLLCIMCVVHHVCCDVMCAVTSCVLCMLSCNDICVDRRETDSH